MNVRLFYGDVEKLERQFVPTFEALLNDTIFNGFFFRRRFRKKSGTIAKQNRENLFNLIKLNEIYYNDFGKA